MELKGHPDLEISEELVEAIRSFPVERTVEHCGVQFAISPFDFYADCPQCGARIKVRSFAASTEIEDLFDAVFEWMNHPTAQAAAQRRQAIIQNDL